MAEPQVNYEDEFTVEDETALSRLEERDRSSSLSSQDLYKAGAYSGMMLPSAGIAEYFGQYPNPEKPGEKIPSFSKNVDQGEYFNAAMQFLGATGDAAYTVPGIGTLTGTGLKALALGGKLSKVQLSKIMDGIGAYMTKTDDPMLAMAGGPNLNIGSSITKMDGTSSGGSKVPDELNLGSGSLFAPEEKAGRRLLVLSCSDTKCPDVGDKEAIDRYLGPVFQSLKSMGTPADVDVAIMSAKHGLIRSDTSIQNYNEKMSPKTAEMFKQDAGQMSRIKNTLDGYDNVIVQGGKDYKDVIRAAAGDTKITEIPGGRGIGDQRSDMKQAIAFGNIDTPVYHYSRNVEKGFTKFDDSDAGYDLLSHLGPHVGSTPIAAKERFINQNFTPAVRTFYLQTKDLDKAIKMAKERYPKDPIMVSPSGNLGKDKSGKFIPRKSYGGSIPLKADLSNAFLDPKTNKPFTEAELRKWVESYKPDLATVDQSFQTARTLRSGLAVEGYTHIPYINDIEDTGVLSYIMLTDRPEGFTKVLQSPAAKKDPAKFDDADFMMEDGGVISLKDKAVNMNRGPRGIEPYVQYMEPGGAVNKIILPDPDPQGPPPELRGNEIELQSLREIKRKKERAEDVLRSFEVGHRFSPQTPFSKYSSPDDPNFIPNKQVNPELFNQYQGYKSGVEFGDTETGMDLLNATKFEPLLQAGLRDIRSLSDYAQVIKQERRGPFDRARNITGVYSSYDDNLLVLSNAVSGQTLAHELMHKGAAYLAKNSKALERLRQGGDAEHRYIQSITNMSFMDRKLNEQSSYLNKLFSNPKASDLLKENIKDGVIRQNNSTLIREVGRVMSYYYSDANRLTFYSELEKRLGITPAMFNEMLNSPREKNIDQETTKQIFTLANEVMANDFATSRFGKNFKKAFDKSDRQDSFFDVRQFEQPRQQTAEQETPRDMAEGGVISLKDTAVRMFENGGEAQIEETMPPQLQGAYEELSQELIQDPRTGDFRYRTDEEIIKILSQFQSQDFLQDVASGGFEIRPSVQGGGSVTNKKSFIGTLDGEPMYKDIRVNQGGGRLGFDAVAPNKDKFGAGVSVYGSKGRAKAPEVLQQFGVDRVKKFGSNKVNVGGLDAYYRMMNALNKGDSVTAGVKYNPNSEETNYNVNYNAPVKDLGIPALTQGAVNMYRRMIR